MTSTAPGLFRHQIYVSHKEAQKVSHKKAQDAQKVFLKLICASQSYLCFLCLFVAIFFVVLCGYSVAGSGTRRKPSMRFSQ
jgi:hypothetical protein